MKQERDILDETWTQPATFLKHFRVMMGPHGLYQHATQQQPLLREGYCLDDNTRAVQVLLHLIPCLSGASGKIAERLLESAWQFLCEAQRADNSFYNFRKVDGQWLSQDISDDMYARLVRALVAVIERDSNTERREQAHKMLMVISKWIPQLTSARAWAEINVALVNLSSRIADEINVINIVRSSSERLIRLWHDTTSSTWPWFEEKLTYANGLLPHGLLAARGAMKSDEFDQIIEKSTQFLITTTIRDDIFIPIGSVGWYPKEGIPSTENQQPIEAGTMTDFLVDYEKHFPGELAPEILIAPYLWFFGANTGRVVMANEEIGASYDGLFAKGPNENYGAESMLAYLWTEIRMRDFPLSIQQQAFAERDKLLAKP